MLDTWVPEPDPLVLYAQGWLRANAPKQVQRTVLVQGDTGPGNFLAEDGRVTGIVDWEFAHVGDPMADLAWLEYRTRVHAGDFDWHRNWYPVAFEADLSDDAPYTFTLLGEPLVFWKDHTAPAGTNPYRCTADKCPHRLVPLSEGRVNERGEIECGYHGWTFRGDDGKCTAIPQLPAGGPAMDTALASPRSCVTPYHAQVAQGILWVYPVSKMTCGDDVDALPPLPLIPELDDPECVCQDIHRDLPMDYGTLLENVMDVSHVPFTHHNSVGKRENATPVVLEMVGDLKAGGFEGIWREGPRNGKYGSQYTEFAAPSLMRHTLKTDAFTTLTVVYAVPTTPGRCRLMARWGVPLLYWLRPSLMLKESNLIMLLLHFIEHFSVLSSCCLCSRQCRFPPR